MYMYICIWLYIYMIIYIWGRKCCCPSWRLCWRTAAAPVRTCVRMIVNFNTIMNQNKQMHKDVHTIYIKIYIVTKRQRLAKKWKCVTKRGTRQGSGLKVRGSGVRGQGEGFTHTSGANSGACCQANMEHGTVKARLCSWLTENSDLD